MTWQDPVALTLAAILFLGALLLRRRLLRSSSSTGCAACTSSSSATASTLTSAPTRVALGALRMSRKSKGRSAQPRLKA